MSSFLKLDGNNPEEKEVQGKSGTSTPFVTKIGAVTVAHTKPSAEPPADFEYLCQPCEGPPATQEPSSDESGDDEDKDEDISKIPPVERNVSPKDVVDVTDDDDFIYVVGTQGKKVTRLHNLENMTKLKDLTCRSCLIGDMDGIVANHSTLHKLELYDNHIQKFSNLEYLKNLVILDMSYNAIRDMTPVQSCVHLEELYLAQNKLRQIQGVENLNHLRVLDLGANRIRVIDAVTTLTSLKSLWLGKNKVERVPDLSPLQKLRQLDLQSNRLTGLDSGLQGLTLLEELYLACNSLHSLDGLPSSPPSSSSAPALNTLDVTTNKIENVEAVQHLLSLEEFWMSSNLVTTTAALLPLKALPALSCLYLEHSPLQKSLQQGYRSEVLAVLPNLTQLDAALVAPGERR